MDPRIWRGNFFNVKKVVYSEAGFPAGNFVASPPPTPLRRHALATVSFPAPLRGHIAQRFAICLRTPFFPRIIFFRYVPFDKLSERVLTQKKTLLPEPVEGACWQRDIATTGSADGLRRRKKTAAPCACRRGARMLHSSWHGAVLAHHFLANQYKGMGGFFQNNRTPPCSPFSWRASDNERERRAKGR